MCLKETKPSASNLAGLIEWEGEMRARFLLSTMALFLLLPTGAAAAPAPQITDMAGDANGLNLGQDTRPGSYDPADLLQVGLETSYVAVPTGGGTRYDPTGLVIRFKTLAPPKSDASTLAFDLRATVSGCPSLFRAFLQGPLTNPGDPRGGTVEWHWSEGCPGIEPTGLPLVVNGTTLTDQDWTVVGPSGTSELVIRIPFDSLSGQAGAVLKPGAVIAQPSASVRPTHGAFILGTFGLWVHNAPIDTTATGASFTVGEDVPPDGS